MKKLLFWGVLALMACTSACTSAFKRGPSSEYKPRHIIVTVHGVRGDLNSFGSFHSIIKEHLEKIDPTYNVLPINYTYPVGQKGYEPYKHARTILDKIDQELKENHSYGTGTPYGEISPNDRLTIIGYSMGGQVTLAWLDIISSSPAYKKYLDQLDTFMNLGAVYWGSSYSESALMDIAAPLNKVNGELFNEMLNLQTVAQSEAEELSPVSKSTLNLRNFRIEQVLRKKSSNPNTQYVSLIGIWPCEFETEEQRKVPGCQKFDPNSKDDKLEYFHTANVELMNGTRDTFMGLPIPVTYGLFGGMRHESDGPVRSASANFDFLFAQDLRSDYVANAELGMNQFSNTKDLISNSKDLKLDIIHAMLPLPEFVKNEFPSLKKDIVVIKPKCKDSKDCDNPTYAYMLKYIARCDRPNSTCTSEANEFINSFSQYPEEPTQKLLNNEMQGFVLDFNLRIPSNYELPYEVSQNHRALLRYLKFDFESKQITFQAPKKRNALQDGILKSKSEDYYLQLARYNELGNFLFKRIKGENGFDDLLVSVQGRIMPKSKGSIKAFYEAKDKGVPVRTIIDLPGLKSRTIIAPVRHTYSTYVDVVLAP